MQCKKLQYLLLLGLLTGCINSFGQQLSKFEYFFDSDPGLGKGTALTLNKTRIDTSYSLSVSTLPNGLHTFFVRAIDTSGRWSFTSTASFVKYSGVDTILNIDRIEYFFDKDPGFGNGEPLTITPGNTINNLFNIIVPDNGKDFTSFHLRVRDSYGRWSLMYDTTYDLCQLYKTTANFDYIRYGSQYSLIDSSLKNPRHVLKWVYDDGTPSDTVMNPVHTLSIGRHFVKLVTGAGCRADSITKGLFTGVESYTPKKMIGGADYNVDVYGAGFDTSCTATLFDGATAIRPIAKKVIDNSHAVFQFDFHKITSPNAARFLTLNVKFPKSNYDTTIQNAIELKSPSYFGFFDSNAIRPLLSVTLNQPGRTGSNTWHYGSFTIQNIGYEMRGAVLQGGSGGSFFSYDNIWYPIYDAAGPVAKLVPFYCTFDNQLQSFELLGFQVNNYYANNSPGLKSRIDSFPLFTYIDSINNQPYQGRLYQMLIPEIGPNQSVTINFRYLTPASLRSELRTYYSVGHNFIGSPMTDNTSSCITSAVSTIATIAQFLPVGQVYSAVAGCGSAVAQTIYDVGAGGASGWNLVSTLANMTWSCVQSAPPVKALMAANQAIFAVANGFNAGASYYQALSSCVTWFLPQNAFSTWNFASSDPNQIVGPSGYDTTYRYVNLHDRMAYQVEFENKAEAARAAQTVMIVDTLSRKFDLNSFQLTHIQIADSIFNIPAFRSQYTTTLDLTKKQKVLVRVNARVDSVTRVFTCTFTSLDPITKQVITDTSLAGFLPPDKDSLSGRASIGFNILQDSLNNNLDQLSNRASIIFDNNAAILTNTWINTLDKKSPVGSIDSVKLVSDTTFRVYYANNDAESGVKTNYLHGAVNSRAYKVLSTSGAKFVDFKGSKDSTYDLIGMAYDNVHNITAKSGPEAHFTLFNLAPVTGDTVICTGNQTKFTDTTSGGVWSSSNVSAAKVDSLGNVTAVAAGTATISYMVNKNGIAGTATRKITVNNAPVKPSITKDQNNVLVSSAAAGNQWYMDTTTLISGATAQTYKPVSSAFYSVRVTQNGCASPFSEKYSYVLTAIINVGAGTYLQVTPNPARDFIVIRHNLPGNNKVNIELYDLNGKKVILKNNIRDGEQLGVATLPAGVYVLKLYNGNGKELGTTRIIKLR